MHAFVWFSEFGTIIVPLYPIYIRSAPNRIMDREPERKEGDRHVHFMIVLLSIVHLLFHCKSKPNQNAVNYISIAHTLEMFRILNRLYVVAYPWPIHF